MQVNVRLERGLAERARTAASQRSVSLATLVALGLEHELGDEATAAGGLLAPLAAVQTELLALAATVERLSSAVAAQSLSAPVVAEPVDTSGPPQQPDPELLAVEVFPEPDPVGKEPVERMGQQAAMPEPPMAVKPLPEPVVEAVASEIGSWLESWWSVSSARGVLAAVDVKLNRPDTDLTAFLARQGQSRTDFDQYLHRLMTQWSRKRSAPVPPDHAEALAAFAADLRAALAKRAEAVARVPPGAAIPAEPSVRS